MQLRLELAHQSGSPVTVADHSDTATSELRVHCFTIVGAGDERLCVLAKSVHVLGESGLREQH
jgi:hypothetical protein